MVISIYPSSVTVAGTTYTTTNGPIHAAVSISSDVVRSHTGDALYSKFTLGINWRCHATVTIQNVKANVAAVGSSAAFSMTVSDGKGNTQTIALTDAVLVGSTHTQPRGLGTQVFEVECFAADGTTAPVS